MVQILNLPFLKNVAKRKNEKMRRGNGKKNQSPAQNSPLVPGGVTTRGKRGVFVSVGNTTRD
jgi:hypothetical protein